MKKAIAVLVVLGAVCGATGAQTHLDPNADAAYALARSCVSELHAANNVTDSAIALLKRVAARVEDPVETDKARKELSLDEIRDLLDDMQSGLLNEYGREIKALRADIAELRKEIEGLKAEHDGLPRFTIAPIPSCGDVYPDEIPDGCLTCLTADAIRVDPDTLTTAP